MRLIEMLLGVIFLSTVLFAQDFELKHFTIQKLDEGGYAICNSGIVDLGDETLVFDSFISPEAAKDLKKVAEENSTKKESPAVSISLPA